MTDFASSHFATEGSIPTLWLYTFLPAQVKEILKKHASIRAICHLDIKVVDFGQEINASIVRQRKNMNIGRQFRNEIRVAKVCFAFERS